MDTRIYRNIDPSTRSCCSVSTEYLVCLKIDLCVEYDMAGGPRQIKYALTGLGKLFIENINIRLI